MSLRRQQGVIVAGFKGSMSTTTSTLERGDRTRRRSHRGGARGGEGVQIYTDVDGVYATRPANRAEHARSIWINYDEMLSWRAASQRDAFPRSIGYPEIQVPFTCGSFSDALWHVDRR